MNFFIRPEVIAAFNRLKKLFIIALILVTFDPEREIIIKINVLRFVIIAILSQLNENKKLRLITYFLRKILGLKRNYEIYDIELLVIIKVF